MFLTFEPNIDIINESLDFGLLNLSGLTVKSSISVELKVYVDASGNLCFEDFSLDEFKLDVKKTNISGTVNLGLFNAEITNGNFLLSIEKNNGADLQTNVSFNFDSAQLKSGSVNVLSLPVKNGEGGVVVPYTFKYDGVQNNWDVPIELKKYTSLSGETLVNQVQIYLNSLQTTLRSAIEDRLKLRNPIYEETAAYGHMGREPQIVTKRFESLYRDTKEVTVELFTWEKLDYVEQIKKCFSL